MRLKHSNTDPPYPLNKIKTKLGRNTQQTGKMTARPVLPGSLKGAQLQPRSRGDSAAALGRDQRLALHFRGRSPLQADRVTTGKGPQWTAATPCIP